MISQYDYNITYRTRFMEQFGDDLMTTVTVVTETEQRHVTLFLYVILCRDSDYSYHRFDIR